ncbi:hypothetical protein [Pseudomonas xanthosomatis]|uniref:hypothetical protein n=1 Tax=Pseudomonas xanthosomatis TaxID=2842356 RepID=UPI0035197060
MTQTVSFRNAVGDLGFFQKDGDHVCLSLQPRESLNTIMESNSWQAWAQIVGAGCGAGDVNSITVEAIQYYLTRYAESVNIKVVEMSSVRKPGVYYPRISRGKVEFDYVSSEFLQDLRAFRNIQESVDMLFNYVEPSESNLKAYGHKIRELLILSCTEVEHLLLKMLVDNGYERKERYTTNDYIKCKEVLGLGDYDAVLAQHNDLRSFKSFGSWSGSSPTKTLPWYSAYNAVKHNRSDNIQDANLEHLLNAVSAIHILLESQYGENIFKRWTSLTEDRSMFSTVSSPKWRCDQVQAPILVPGWDISYKWTEERKYFDDHPV